MSRPYPAIRTARRGRIGADMGGLIVQDDAQPDRHTTLRHLNVCGVLGGSGGLRGLEVCVGSEGSIEETREG
jgi:hypothetical protein